MSQLGLDTAPLDRLARLEADPTLCHTGARWRAHAYAYPESKSRALDLAASYAEKDEALRVELTETLAEFREKASDDVSSIRYLSWLADEMGAAA